LKFFPLFAEMDGGGIVRVLLKHATAVCIAAPGRANYRGVEAGLAGKLRQDDSYYWAMGQPRVWAVTASLGVAVVAASVVMAFLHNHHWLISYDMVLIFERAFWWVQFTGLIMFIVGCVGLVANLTPRRALFVGMAFVVAALLLPLAFGGYLAVVNAHDWTTVTPEKQRG
jgi:hypothetical protein